MTNERRIRANRANGQASTGPKTAKGKSIAAKNAYRHGLNCPVFADPAYSKQVEALAKRISGNLIDDDVRQIARSIAEAEVDLWRVRNTRQQVLSGELNVLSLLALDRYERRALSRRKFAIRAFDCIFSRYRRR